MASIPPVIGCTTYHKYAAQKTSIEIYGLMPAYTQAISAAGGVPLLIPLGLKESELKVIFDRVDGILFPGGGDINASFYQAKSHPSLRDVNPERDRIEQFLIRRAVSLNKPFFAICRGLQMLNVALGGSLWQDVKSQMPGAIAHDGLDDMPRSHLMHSVEVDPTSLLAKCLGKTHTAVNSLHHQGVRLLSPQLRATAVAPDGLIEGMELVNHPFALAVQWHPENLIEQDTAMLALFQGLVEAARQQQ